jgi:dTDP-4-amino-4,6-dideoxygalactose transaminase
VPVARIAINRFITRRSPNQPRPLEDLHVPFVDLGPSNGAVKRRVLERIGETIDRGDFTNGHAVAEFERALAGHVGRQHCVAVSSGLDALRLSLVASGLARGGGVIVPAMTFAATFEAVIQAGGTPLVVDVADDDYNLDVGGTERAATNGTTHMLPVHLYGQMADMRRLSRVAERHGLQIVEDACQAHGARRDGLAAGSVGLAATFSFYPTKNLGAMGDGGALLTDDDALAEYARALRVHGETRKYHHDYVGYTARLDTIQAVVLLEKLPMLEEWNRQRRAAAQFYTHALADLQSLDLGLPLELTGSDAVWHLYVVRTSNPEQLGAFLADRGVQTGRHYPEPPHLAPAYRSLGFGPGDFPVAEALAREGLSLPLFPGITEAQLAHVCEAVQRYFGLGERRRTLVGRG